MAKPNDIHVEIPASGLIHVATVTLTSQQLLNLNNGPVEIIPAQGRNKHAEILYGILVLSFGTTSYVYPAVGSNSFGIGTMGLNNYVQSPIVWIPDPGLINGQVETLLTSFPSQGITSSGEELPKLDNKAWGFGHVQNSDFNDLTGGDGTMTITLFYIVTTLG